jgi:CspA family cold shock protein
MGTLYPSPELAAMPSGPTFDADVASKPSGVRTPTVGAAPPTQGTVKWFDVKKGFGFIVGPEGQDVFVHFSAIEGDGFRTLKDGERVAYVLNHGDKGFNATQVRRLEDDLPDRDPDRPTRRIPHDQRPAPVRRSTPVDGYVG